MADISSTLLAFPPDNIATFTPEKYDKGITTHIKELEKLPPSTWMKPVDKKNVLDLLNPQVNTLPYLFGLVVQSKQVGKDRRQVEAMMSRAVHFFENFDRVQARYALDRWTGLLIWLFELMEQSNVADFRPITTALLRLDPTGGTFTSWHLRLLRACLVAGVPSHVLPLLNKTIYAFPQPVITSLPKDLMSEDLELSNAFINVKAPLSYQIRPEWVLEYYLLGAQIYIGYGDYARARLFFAHVLLTPSQQHAYSALQVEAYKKWLMIGLLSQGKLYPQPRTMDQTVMKSIRALARSYEALTDCFETRNTRKFHAEVDAGAPIWSDDGNSRLVRDVGAALYRQLVFDLQKTYAVLPVGRVAQILGWSISDTSCMLTDMIEGRTLDANIASVGTNPGDAVLTFHDSTPAVATAATQDDDIEAQTKRIENLVTYMRDADRRLQLTKEYIEHAKRMKRNGEAPGAELDEEMDLTWEGTAGVGESFAPDEDIMAP